MIERQEGRCLAEVISENRQVEARFLPQEVEKLLGPAQARDVKQQEENQEIATQNRQMVEELILQHGLEMKLVSISYTLDRKKVRITYTAERRVDFRALLKDLARLFKARIELRQITSREEAKVYGGLGACGRPLCCSSFLGQFPNVSIKMVKNQNLSLNTTKNTGLCGRLLCCLSYEDDYYRESKERFPDLGQTVHTKDGDGQVVGINIIAESVKIKLAQTQHQLTYPLEEVEVYV